jgi:hypothetical protein
LSAIEGIPFEARERKRQATYFSSEFPGKVGYRGSDCRVAPADRLLNLSSAIREQANAYFNLHRILWHMHANHALSSQACCLNFLMPLAERPALLARLVSHALGVAHPEMLAVESGPNEQEWFVGFEWIGGDYLNEAGRGGRRTRGANCTSADAVVRFRQAGVVTTVLIEWKYTEKSCCDSRCSPSRCRRRGSVARTV